MVEIARILFPVDLSPASPRIVPYVRTMAEKFQSEIHLLFVVRRFQHLADMYVSDPEILSFEEGIFEGAGKRLDEFRSEYFTMSANIETTSVPGDPAEGIITYTEAEELDEFKKKHFVMSENIRSSVEHGDPAEGIINYAQTEKIDMIIMGTHGRKGLNRIVFGSVAERVVKSSPVPVFTVNPYKADN